MYIISSKQSKANMSSSRKSFDKEDKVYRERGERERWRSEEYNRRRRERRRKTLFKMSIAFCIVKKKETFGVGSQF